MPRDFHPTFDSLIPPQPLPAGADDFARQVHNLLDGRPKDEATVERALAGIDDMLDQIAVGLYSLASMLVGEGEEGARLVETTIATADVSSSNPQESRQNSRRALAAAALETLARRDPSSLAAPEGFESVQSCIEDEDLDAAAEYGEELQRMIAGPDRDRVRDWLESLPVDLRTIFVLRAVAGFTAAEIAALLAEHGGPRAAGWTANSVREFFRQGLCSLASQLLQATAAR
ncbi:MAG TPA: sigma factor-like helix-turn-helix DNA-binding protein [Terracidiphilus sp.]|nr:sigma factor-like helix-turn-helix DNA-binding protein [Terracidiphilus sp.]